MNDNLARNWETSYIAAEPKQDKQTVVKVHKKRWITKGEKVLYTVTAFLLVVACIYVVSFASSTDTLNREVKSLEQNVQEQKWTNEELAYKQKQLERPERITRIAKENGLEIQNAQVKQAATYSSK